MHGMQYEVYKLHRMTPTTVHAQWHI